MIYVVAKLSINARKNSIHKLNISNGKKPMGEALLKREGNMRKQKLIGTVPRRTKHKEGKDERQNEISNIL